MRKFLYILIFVFGLISLSYGQNKISADQNTPSRLIKFYPNPASSFISFDFQKGYISNYSLLIFNFMGKKIYELKNIPSRTDINLEEFYRGIYIYQLREKNGSIIESGKFQVIK